MTSNAILRIKTLADLPAVSKELLRLAGERKVWLFYGEMGVGKTTLINALCKTLGVEDQPSSPTFSIVNEYFSPSGPIYHFDFYRIRSEQEALDLGYEEYFYSGQRCLVEWPDQIPSLIPTDAFSLEITLGTGQERIIQIVRPESLTK